MSAQPFDFKSLGIMQVPDTTPAPAAMPAPAVNAPLEGALRMISLGVPVAPVTAGDKKWPIKGFPTLATTDRAQVLMWANEQPNCNWACVARSDEYCFLDEDDSERIRAEHKRVYDREFPKTLTTESRPGHRQSIWKQTDATRKLGNKGQDAFVDEIMSFRQNGEYVMAAMSHLNPDAKKGTGHRDYVVVDDSPIMGMPDSVLELIYQFLLPAENKVTAKSLAKNPEQQIPEHTRNGTLASIAGGFQQTGMSDEGIREEIHRINEERCSPEPLPLEEVDAILNSILKYEKGDPLQNVVLFAPPNPLAGIQQVPATKGKAADYTPLEFKYPPTTDIESTGEDRDYVVGPPAGSKEGWFPRGHTSVIGGPSGGCKSTTMIDLLQAQKEREPFLGHTTYGMPYIIVQMDRGKRANRRTIDRMNLNEKSIPCCPIPVVWDDGAIHKLLEIIETCNPGPSIVFLEGMDMMVSEPHKLEKVAPFLSALNNIAEHYHIAIIGSVGSPKAKKGEGYAGGRDKIFGSVAWSRMTETVAMLQYIDGDDADARRSLVILLRNGPAEKFELKMGSNGRLEQVRPEAKSTVKKHLVWMEVQGDWWSVSDLATELQISVATAYRYVEDAYAKRLIRTKHKAAKFARLYQWNTVADKEQIEKSEKDAANFAQAKAEFEQAGILEKQEAREAARKRQEAEHERKQEAARAKKYRRGKKGMQPGKLQQPEMESGPTEP